MGNAAACRRPSCKMPSPNEYSWTILISAYAQNGHFEEALQLFSTMALSGFKPNNYTVIAALNACGRLGNLRCGKNLHQLLDSCGFLDSLMVGNALIHMYGKCRELEAARRVFGQLPDKDVVSWNTIISAYAQNGHGKQALELYNQMNQVPDKVTYVGVLDACASTQDLDRGRIIHARIISQGIQSDTVLENTILNMYAKCRSLDDAKVVFEEMSSPSFVTWNIMILAYAQNGYIKEALETFQKMDLEGVQGDAVTFATVLDACAHARALSLGRAIHQSIIGSSTDVALGNAVMNLYGRCGCPADARRVFVQMFVKDVVSWTAMISAYVGSGFGREALRLYREMCLEGCKPNDVTMKTALDACAEFGSLADGKEIHSCISTEQEMMQNIGNSLLNLYSKCGEVELARAAFEKLQEKDLFSCTTMIQAYSQKGRDTEAIELFHKMVAQGIQPDAVAFSMALHSCANSGSLTDGKAIHEILFSRCSTTWSCATRR